MIKLNYSRRFRVEISEITEYLIRNLSKEAAIAITDSIMSSISLLTDFPRLGVFRAYDVTYDIEYHLLVSGRYFIYYSIKGESIKIDGIKDSRQRYYSI